MATTISQAVFDSKEATRAARLGHQAAVRDLENTPRHLLEEGNPNHPMYDLHLFGEHHEVFMSRQYKLTHCTQVQKS